jgi:hypothetical protein
MKKIIQLLLIFLLIIISLFFYNKYFKESQNSKLSSKYSQSETLNDNSKNEILNESSNVIKNLRYEVIFNDKKNYIIESKYNEISYDGDIEIVSMNEVFAVFSDENEIPLIIYSDKAKYNNTNYNTNFYENVKITYLNHNINSDKLDLNFKENIVKIYDNVIYEGAHGSIVTENVLINLLTKDVEIYMNDKKDKVEVNSKN